jgi:hypothetical protein
MLAADSGQRVPPEHGRANKQKRVRTIGQLSQAKKGMDCYCCTTGGATMVDWRFIQDPIGGG